MKLPDSTELLKRFDTTALWLKLGLLAESIIPGMKRHVDPTGGCTGWFEDDGFDTEVAKFGRNESSRVTAFRMSWHQLAGIVRMLQLAFEGLPAFIMDEVGVGKTLQAIGFIAVLCHFREYYDKHADYPGEFSMYTCLLPIHQLRPNRRETFPNSFISVHTRSREWTDDVFHSWARENTLRSVHHHHPSRSHDPVAQRAL